MGGRRPIVLGDDLNDGQINKKIHGGLRWPPFSGNTQQPTNVGANRLLRSISSQIITVDGGLDSFQGKSYNMNL